RAALLCALRSALGWRLGLGSTVLGLAREEEQMDRRDTYSSTRRGKEGVGRRVAPSSLCPIPCRVVGLPPSGQLPLPFFLQQNRRRGGREGRGRRTSYDRDVLCVFVQSSFLPMHSPAASAPPVPRPAAGSAAAAEEEGKTEERIYAQTGVHITPDGSFHMGF